MYTVYTFSECQHFSNFANTFLTAPHGNVNTYLGLPTLFSAAPSTNAQHISKLANTYLLLDYFLILLITQISKFLIKKMYIHDHVHIFPFRKKV